MGPRLNIPVGKADICRYPWVSKWVLVGRIPQSPLPFIHGADTRPCGSSISSPSRYFRRIPAKAEDDSKLLSHYKKGET
ncbi:hypothetical protein PIB30_060925 [Stylosanthes scabra]|uniref:Uncharacterized protein n=1 Tax=Stylosanthes scabra TaxID=79078 RepID=A0ABU6SKT1_9FABA|nr:hypothetical protein [Stylosanthes scabra]